MQERAELLETLPPDVRGDAQKLYDELRTRQTLAGGDTIADGPDPRDILGELHRRGLLDQGQLREAVLALEASLKVRSRREEPPEKVTPVVLGRLGAGAMGEVLIAKDPGLDRVVAVKRLLPEGAKRKAMVRRFYKEAQITAQLDHPGIVPIHGLVETEDGGLAYAMKLVRGRTLEDYLEEAREQHRAGSPDAEHALPARLEVFLHVCDALAYAHDRGVLHRDLKPENIMVGAFGEVLIMDWGIAKLLNRPGPDEDLGEGAAPAPTSAKETRVGTIMGTPRYMAPEQAEGRTDLLDPRSDQYALGMILFELVSLSPAMKLGIDLEAAIRWAQLGRKQPLVHAFGERIPRELAAIVDKATKHDRDQRYASVAALADDVRRFLRDEEVLAKRDNVLQRAQRWLGRHRQLVMNLLLLLTLGIVATGALGLVAVGGTVTALTLQAKEREQQITAVLGVVSQRAQQTETELHRIEGLLHGLAYAAAYATSSTGADLPYDPVREDPPRMRPGTLYERPVSVDWPRIASASASPPRSDVVAVAGLGPQLARILIESSPTAAQNRLDDRARHKLIAETGVPIVWARVATMDGLEASLPGTSGLVTSAMDPRKAPWFVGAKGQRGVKWLGPTVDDRGQGLVYTAALPVLDGGGRGLGVAAIDLSVDHLAHLVRAPDGAEGAWLLDEKGQIVVDGRTRARTLDKFDPKPFHRGELWKAIQATPSGWTDTTDGQLAVWSPLPTLGLTYVIVAPAEVLTRRVAEKRSALGAPAPDGLGR